jgi:hypothetical protein
MSRDQFPTELTPEGEQFVIPGCETDKRRGPAQFNLWGNAPPKREDKRDVPHKPVNRG